MNHPFPQSIPLLRRIYSGRFHETRFLVPFHRTSDADVITVYRGSYSHAGYLADAGSQLSNIDCDYYLVVHDDVLLNPKLCDSTFADLFPIGPHDGFLAKVQETASHPLQSSWIAGTTLRQLFPKSMLFGSGIEPETLAKYLPTPERLQEGYERAGVSGTDSVHFPMDPDRGRGVLGSVPSRLMLHGLSQWLPSGPAQDAVERHSEDALHSLIQGMLEAHTLEKSDGDDEIRTIKMPFPTVTSHYYTDIYVVPKRGFADFSHYMGVCAAANLFVEVMAPTMMFASCERVWTAGDIGLDFSGFDIHRPLQYFDNERNIAIHPFKLSAFKDEAKAEALLSSLTTIARDGVAPSHTMLSSAGFGRWQTGFVGYGKGWHAQEGWGLWSGDRTAEIPIFKRQPGPLRITLHPPGGALMVGRLILPDGRRIELSPPMNRGDFPVEIEDFDGGPSGAAVIILENDALYRLCDLDPNGVDAREIGFGLIRIEGSDL
jgi:hypothetical protein